MKVRIMALILSMLLLLCLTGCEAEPGRNSMALEFAIDALDRFPFSEKELEEDLLEEGFSPKEAKYALDNCGADWYKNALKSTMYYMDTVQTTDQDMLMYWLTFHKFEETDAQRAIQYATDPAHYTELFCSEEWLEKKRQDADMDIAYYTFDDQFAFSESGLLKQLIEDGYTEEMAKEAIEGSIVDWNEQAVKAAKKYLYTPSPEDELYDHLLKLGFTKEQANYAIEQERLEGENG